MSAITWIVKLLDGSEKAFTNVTALLKAVGGKVFSTAEYKYRPNIVILIETNPCMSMNK